MTFAVERSRGSPAGFHQRALPEPASRQVWVFEADAPALVLGSTQPDAVADAQRCRAAGVEVVRRRSGGGAVLVEPGDVVWVDVVLPAGDPLWDDDVGRAAYWLGDVWAGALGAVAPDLGALAVHRGGLERRRWSALVCFAGLGPGEVTGSGGAKVVGIAQRRTRAAARFQCAVPRRWDAARLVDLLALEPADRARAAADLAGAAIAVEVDPGVLLDAFVERLPT